jgi:hypothetical protein
VTVLGAARGRHNRVLPELADRARIGVPHHEVQVAHERSELLGADVQLVVGARLLDQLGREREAHRGEVRRTRGVLPEHVELAGVALGVHRVQPAPVRVAVTHLLELRVDRGHHGLRLRLLAHDLADQ